MIWLAVALIAMFLCGMLITYALALTLVQPTEPTRPSVPDTAMEDIIARARERRGR